MARPGDTPSHGARLRSARPRHHSLTLQSLLPLAELPALEARWSGDLHVHMNYGGAYRNDASTPGGQAEAEDLHVVDNLIVNKEQRIPDIALFLDRARSLPAPPNVPLLARPGVPHELLGPYGPARPA